MTVTLLVGTTKGAFLLRGDDARKSFETTGPFLAGSAVYAMAYDAARDRVLASASNPFYGTTLASTADWGVTWDQPETPNVAFPADTDTKLENIWQIVPEGDTIWVGVEPAALFKSTDGGQSYDLVRGLWDHPHRPTWEPGAGGLCLHTILRDGPTTFVAISAAGVYRTDDGGETWQPRNEGIRADFRPDKYPEYGQCVHKIAFDAGSHDVLWAQNHGGLYRSDDRAEKWQDVGNGVPSDFGFPIVTHPTRPGTAYVIPLGGEMRTMPEGKARVYRTTDSGASWEPLSQGLPQEGAHLTILRDAFATDGLAPAGLYFGTRSGEVYGSADDGETWQQVAAHLPPVTCVKTAVVG